MAKKSFVLYYDYKEQIDLLTLEEKGKLLDAIFIYEMEGKVIELDGMIKMAFYFIKNNLDRDKEKYDKICERNIKNIEKRWKDKNTKNTTGKTGIPKDTKNTDNDTDNVNDTDNDKDNNIPYKEIIDYLNEKAGTKYRSSGAKTKDLIKARWNEKFKLEDFKTVIDKKCKVWKNTDMAKYIRPETLFSNKFEGYLNEIVTLNKNQESEPNWFDKETKAEQVSTEEEQEMKDLLGKFR